MIKVCLIEDDDTDAELFEKKFSNHVSITRYKKLSESHDINSHDVVLLDLMLKETLGKDTVQQCRLICPSLPIIVLTHVSDPLIQAQCMESGADYFFRKGEQAPETLLRAMEASIAVSMSKRVKVGEVAAAKKYIEKVSELLREIDKRIESITS